MLTLIDNYDSFTYNLYQLLAKLGADIKVLRNDAVTAEESAKNTSAFVISPGPGRPQDAGISQAIIKNYAGKVPILGVCLGHQTIGEVFGAKVVKAPKPIHGMQDTIKHNGKGLFEGLPQDMVIGRYHSLVVEKESLSDDFVVTAENSEGLIMALQHKTMPVYGVQFHPESILTPDGEKLLANFLLEAKKFTA